MPQKVKDMDFMCFAISRTEIETGDTMVFSKMLDRFKSAKEYLVAAHNKVEFSISGFDDDPRELYEIPMVVNWFKAMVQDVECLIYFLYMGPGSLALATTVHCLSGVRKIAKDTAELPDLAPVKAFVDHQYDRLNKFTERYDLETLNREISEKFAERMKGVIAPSGRAPKPAKRPKPTAKTKGKVRAPRK